MRKWIQYKKEWYDLCLLIKSYGDCRKIPVTKHSGNCTGCAFFTWCEKQSDALHFANIYLNTYKIEYEQETDV